MMMLTCVGLQSTAQDSALAMQKAYYLKKAENQKTTGFILLGTGAAATIIGFLIANGSNSLSDDDLYTGTWMLLIGGGAMVASVPFFISSGSNNRRAATITVGATMLYLPKDLAGGARCTPGLSVAVGLR